MAVMAEQSPIFVSNDEITMLRDSARRFLAQKWPAERAVALSERPEALRQLWREIADQGWLSLGAEDDSCMHASTVLLEELGAASCPAPLLDTVIANMVLRSALSSEPGFRPLVDAIQRGDAVVACVLEPDSDAITVQGKGDNVRLSGRVAFIDGLSIATHVLAFPSDASIAVLSINSEGVELKPTPGFSVPPLGEISLKDVRALVGSCDWNRAAVQALARLGLCARALGAAARGFNLIVDYAKVRVQFGKKIGQYQAIQHKLANCLINLDISRLAILRAAGAFDRATKDWVYAASAAFSVASPALRQVCLETHHAFGGVSFWEEHEMPRHFRRIHADLARCGGVHAAREAVANFLLEGQG